MALYKYSWYALLASFVPLLYLFPRAFHAAYPLDPIFPRLAHALFHDIVGAERSVVKNEMLESLPCARVHIATAGEFCAVVGFDSP